MKGMAGTGEITTAYTSCAKLERSTQLGGSFFCSCASSERQDVGRIVPTIDYQLGNTQTDLGRAYVRSTPKQSISAQLEQLLVELPAKIKESADQFNMLIVIDGSTNAPMTKAFKRYWTSVFDTCRAPY